MFCTKCGSQIADDSKFCEVCGERFDNVAPATNNTGANPVDAFKNGVNRVVKKGNKQMLMIGGIAIAALVVVIVLFNVIFGSSPKKAVKDYFDNAIKIEEEGTTENDAYWLCTKASKKLDIVEEDEIEYDYEIDIKKVSKYKKSDEEFEFIQDYVDDNLDGDGDAIKGVAYVKTKLTEITIEDGDEDKGDSETVNFIVVKIGGKWYMTTFTKEEIEEAIDD